MIVSGIGFTGTRNEPTSMQRDNLFRCMQLFAKAGNQQPDTATIKANSGDCIGADALFHQLAVVCGFYTVGHIPEKTELRAYCEYDEENPPLNYFGRNRTIVAASDVLLAIPRHDTEDAQGGTWYTINFARKREKPVIIFWPDGRVTKENF